MLTRDQVEQIHAIVCDASGCYTTGVWCDGVLPSGPVKVKASLSRGRLYYTVARKTGRLMASGPLWMAYSVNSDTGEVKPKSGWLRFSSDGTEQ